MNDASRTVAAREPAYLFKISAAREPAHADRVPPQLCHQLRQPSIGAGTPGALRDFENIEHSLRGDPLDAVVADLTTQASERRAPRVGVANDGPSLGGDTVSPASR
jgi:hypothetical protein